ncbi:MAG: hypothetical protein KDI36_05230, partial [Pseudomonadales bacterium]|nr:hypothetical protein [Pseudomonadales bacterium]
CAMDNTPMPKSMVLSKGIHIVVPREKLPVSHMVFTVTTDNRPVFAIPRGDTVYIGTTDTRYEKGAEIWPEVLPDEVTYLFEPIKRYFGVELTMNDCLTTWAGLRPLIAETGKSTREISRKDEVWVSDSGLITIAGGKLTGYRKMAEETVDAATRLLDFKVSGGSADVPLPGGDFHQTLEELARDLTQKFPMPEKQARRLCRLYGTEAADVLALGSDSLKEEGFVHRGEVYWALQQEGARHLEDVLYRRTRAALYRTGEVRDILEPVASIMASELGWSAERLAAECQAARERLQSDISPLAP